MSMSRPAIMRMVSKDGASTSSSGAASSSIWRPEMTLTLEINSATKCRRYISHNTPAVETR